MKAPVVASVSQRSWNPAFTCDFSSDAPRPLSEERRLLLEERRHWQSQSGRLSPAPTGTSKRQHHSSHAVSGSGTEPDGQGGNTSSSDSSLYTDCSQSKPWRRLSPESLDSQISSHSIFTLNQPFQRGQPKGLTHEQNRACSQADSSVVKLPNRLPVATATSTLMPTPQPIESAAVLATNPLTSTPRPVSLPAQRVSLSNVLYARELEALADVYARMIEGGSCAC